MTRYTSQALLCVLCASAVNFLCGCATRQQTFPGHDPAHVWTAMIAVANTPDYSGDAAASPTQLWTVRDNRVWVDEPGRRIEIARRVERNLYEGRGRWRHEARDWQIQVVMVDRDPPAARFVSRGVGVPAHAWREAERYFADVREMLGEPPEPQPLWEAPTSATGAAPPNGPARSEEAPARVNETPTPADDTVDPPVDISDIS